MKESKSKKIALVENFGSDFYNARLRYAIFLKEKGHEVVAVIPNDGFVRKIQSAGIKVIPLNDNLRKRNFKNIIFYIFQLKKIFESQKFDVIHLYRMQPNLFGTFVAYFTNKKHKIINHITGLGIAFANDGIYYKLIRIIIKSIYKINHRLFKAELIFQNNEDKIELGDKATFVVIKGSAVNEEKFYPKVGNEELKQELLKIDSDERSLNLIFVSRLLRQKGLGYLVEAVEIFNRNKKRNKINLLVVGWIDKNNPDSFTNRDIELFKNNERIIFLGKRNDINDLIAISDVAILPTFYREGTPRFLLEAMAMSKPIITTNMPGCRHLINNNLNGELIEPKSVEEILMALDIVFKKNITTLGEESRKLYIEQFSEELVYNSLLKMYLI